MSWWWPTKKQIEKERADDTVIHIVFKENGQIRTINNESPYEIAVGNDGSISINPKENDNARTVKPLP